MAYRFKLGSVIVIGLAMALDSGPALAGSRSAVSLTGSDTGTCAVTTPCRTLAYALTQTSPNGEILIKESGGYGPIIITQAVTINAPPGVIGFISAPSGDAITVNAGLNDNIIVTGLYLDGLGTGSNGVTVNTGRFFSIAGSTITGFTGNSINYVSNTAAHQKLTVINSSVYGNGGPILIKPAAASSLFSSIRGLTLASNGIVVDNTSAPTAPMYALIDNSILRYIAPGTTITANSAGTPNVFVRVSIDKSELFNLDTAMATSGGAIIDINDSKFTSITTFCTASSLVNSFGTNALSLVNGPGSTPCTPTQVSRN